MVERRRNMMNLFIAVVLAVLCALAVNHGVVTGVGIVFVNFLFYALSVYIVFSIIFIIMAICTYILIILTE